MPLQAGDIIQATMQRSLQNDLRVVAASRGPQAAQDCIWYGDACCKLMSSGVWRCSYPGGACTPGLEGCPAWLVNEIKRRAALAVGFTMQPGFPSRRRQVRLASRLAAMQGYRY